MPEGEMNFETSQSVGESCLVAVERFVRNHMLQFDASHDYNHIDRVVSMARHIYEEETMRIGEQRYSWPIIHLSALLHDVTDKKYLEDSMVTPTTGELLQQFGTPSSIAEAVEAIVPAISWSKEAKNPDFICRTLQAHPELKIVQDADRLDAIGAIGIARVFTYGGAKRKDASLETILEHFGEKLERIEGKMKTATGKELAVKRTQKLKVFKEWWLSERNFPKFSDSI